MALGLFSRSFVGLYGIWSDPNEDARNDLWFRDERRRLLPHTVGHYIGESDLRAEPGRAERSFTPEAWRRLREVRRQHDPDLHFHSFPET